MSSNRFNKFPGHILVTVGLIALIFCCPQLAIAQNPYRVSIEKTHGTLHDSTRFVHSIGIYLDAAAGPVTGFEFSFGFDTTQFKLISATGDSALMSEANGAGWDYFSYTSEPFGPCGPACGSGKVKIFARADIGSVPGSGSPFNPTSFPAKLATLTFETPSDSLWECQLKLLRFVWFDCHDNYLVGGDGSTVHVERDITDFDLIGSIADSTSGYPTYGGIQSDTCALGFTPQIVRDIKFLNGGFDFVCLESIDARGDINLNQIPYEIADAVLFSRYFLNGLSVFTVNAPIQLSVTDVNADGFKGSVEDLAYLARIILGLSPSFPRGQSGENSNIIATLSRAGEIWSIDRTISAGFIVAKGNVVPEVLAPNLSIGYTFENNRTRILLSGILVDSIGIDTASGPILKLSAPIVYAEFTNFEADRIQTIYDCCEGIRGDANGVGNLNVVDLTVMVQYLFVNTEPHIICPDEADINNSGGINVADVALMVSYLFQQGPPPASCP
jgi:hypothetical protein